MLRILLTLLAGLYAISPFDFLPEMVVGWLGCIDDLLVLFLLWRYFYAQGSGYRRNTAHRQAGGGRESSGTGAGDEAPKRPSQDPYTVLGVSRNASLEEIKKSYKRLAGQYHPDKVHHLAPEFRELAEKRFKEIQKAYDTVRRR